MKFTRVEPGHYRSTCGRVEIKKDVSIRNSGRRTLEEVCWVVWVDGKELHLAQETLADAKRVAQKKIDKEI